MAREKLILFIGLVVILGVVLGAFVLLAPQNRPLPSRIPSAFYTGGMQQGKGGQIANTYSQEALTPEALFEPSPARTSSGMLMPPEAYPSSTACASCHTDLHQNWQNSMHSIAAKDQWYLKVKEFLEFEQGPNAVRQCAGCHAPVALMTGEVGLYNQESNRSTSQGVNCIFCHTISETHGGNGAYVSDPGRVRMYKGGDYLSEKGIENAAHLVMASPGVHREDMHPKWISGVAGSQMCQSCHSFNQDGVPLQSTYEEWKTSSYYQEGISCQDCHFTSGAGVTLEGGKLVNPYPSKNHILKHTLGGGSTVQSPQAELNKSILKDTFKLHAYRQGKTLLVEVTNVKAGHSVPTGVSDLRELWLEVTALNSKGNVLMVSGAIDASGSIEKGSTIFHTVFGDENGHPIIRHDIWRAKSVLKDTRLKAKETRKIPYSLPTGTTSVKVRLLWRDAPGEFIAWVLKQNHQEIPVTELAQFQL